MNTTEAQRKAEFFSLMGRFVQLGTMLDESFDVEDANARANAKMIIAEMNKTKALIDKMIEFEQPWGHDPRQCPHYPQ